MKRGAQLVKIVGGGAAAGLIVLGFIDGRAALAGWLAGFILWSGVPLGALLLAMMATLVPGRWRGEIAAPAEALAVFMPLVGVAVLPVLVGVRALYPWAEEAGGQYLTAGFFALRSILLLAMLVGLGGLRMLRPAWALPLSAGGLILFVLLDTTLSVDWLMSLEPHFHSSGFGLYVVAIQANVALAVVILMRLSRAEAEPTLLGALMLAGLLLWAYLAFMPYFISWSENLPEPARWYALRGTGIWSAAELAIGALHLVPLVLLFFTPVRASRPGLRAMAGAVLLGKAIEVAWLVFPSTDTGAWLGSVNELLALIVLGALSLVCFAWITQTRAIRPQRRTP